MKQLPDKPSKLIELALKDLEKVEKDKKRYEVDMGTYHFGNAGDKSQKCSVCFAGSVMAKSLKAAITKDVDPGEFGNKNAQKLYALDDFRQGRIGEAYETLGRDLPWGILKYVYVPEYRYKPKTFKAEMTKLAKLLKAVGE